jgi:effector-binding domain-containing protein
VPACYIASARQIVPTAADMPKYRGIPIEQLYSWLKFKNVVPVGHEIVLYHLSEYSETNIDMEFAVTIPEPTKLTSDPIRDITVRQLPTSEVASTFHSGMIHDITQAVAALFTWIGANGYTSSGAIREIHLFGSETVQVRDRPVVIELQIPIELLKSTNQVL